MNITKFRNDFYKRLQEENKSQLCLARELGIEQASISRFLSGKSGLDGKTILALFPFVYGDILPDTPCEKRCKND